MSALAAVRDKAQTLRRDEAMVKSVLMLATTLLMAGGGALFWVIAARLASPTQVGLAGSLVAAGDALALFAQLGLNIGIVRTMPISRDKAGDVTTACALVFAAALLLALGYCLLLPVTAPRLLDVLGSPIAIGLYCLMVAGTALNVFTDSVFLAVNKVWTYLKLNGVLMVVTKLALPFVLVGAGAFGLYSASGAAYLLCAVVSVFAVFRGLPGRRRLRPSPELWEARHFTGAGYAAYVLHVVPQMVLPLIVVNFLGAGSTAIFFISFQIVTLQNALNLAVGNAAYADAERAETGRHRIVRRTGTMVVLYAAAGSLVVLVAAPLVLHIFGGAYADNGAWTLRILSFSAIATAFNYWGAFRLRLSRHLPSMVGVQLASTVAIIGFALLAAPYGTAWVAAAWGAGHAVGAALGFLASTTIARFPDGEPLAQPQAGTA